MTVRELRETLLLHYEQILPEDAYVAEPEDAGRRPPRILDQLDVNLRAVWQDLWMDRVELDFHWKSGTVTLTAGQSSAAAPTDFHTFGSEGSMYITSPGIHVLERRPFDEVTRIRTIANNPVGRPTYYDIHSASAAGVPTVHFDTVANVTYTIAIYYRRKPPALFGAPGRLTATVTAVAGNPNGTYQYKVTFTHAGGETDAGPASLAVVTGGAFQVSLSKIQVGPPGTTGRKVYRTVAGGSTFKLLTTISDNATVVFTDNVADGALGADLAASGFVTGLEELPDQYHDSLLLMGLMAHSARLKGDGKAEIYLAEYERQKKMMRAQRRQDLQGLGRLGDMGLTLYGSW